MHLHNIPWKNIGLVIGSIGTLWGIGQSFYNSRSQSRRRKPNIIVRCKAGANVYGSELSEAMLYVNPVNQGEKAVNITSIILEIPDKQRLALMDQLSGPGLPLMLEPERGADYWFSLRDVARTIAKNGHTGDVKVRGVARDAVGREYKSKPYKIVGVENWAKKS